jgi:hypothetical protein
MFESIECVRKYQMMIECVQKYWMLIECGQGYFILWLNVFKKDLILTECVRKGPANVLGLSIFIYINFCVWPDRQNIYNIHWNGRFYVYILYLIWMDSNCIQGGLFSICTYFLTEEAQHWALIQVFKVGLTFTPKLCAPYPNKQEYKLHAFYCTNKTFRHIG